MIDEHDSQPIDGFTSRRTKALWSICILSSLFLGIFIGIAIERQHDERLLNISGLPGTGTSILQGIDKSHADFSGGISIKKLNDKSMKGVLFSGTTAAGTKIVSPDGTTYVFRRNTQTGETWFEPTQIAPDPSK